jgi:hypothetical protein
MILELSLSLVDSQQLKVKSADASRWITLDGVAGGGAAWYRR